MRLLVVIGCSLLALSGCSRFERTRQCRALADYVNPELDRIEALHRSKKPSAEKYEAIARHYEVALKGARSVRMTDPTMATTLEQYTQILSSTVAHTRSLGQALAARDGTRTARDKQQLSALTRREKQEVTQLDALCRAP